MDVSLFKLLSEKHPSAIVSLRYQYRMHKDIMILANELIYGHRMQCGTNERSGSLWKLPRFPEFRERNKVGNLGKFFSLRFNTLNRQADRQIDRQTELTDRQADRHSNR